MIHCKLELETDDTRFTVLKYSLGEESLGI